MRNPTRLVLFARQGNLVVTEIRNEEGHLGLVGAGVVENVYQPSVSRACIHLRNQHLAVRLTAVLRIWPEVKEIVQGGLDVPRPFVDLRALLVAVNQDVRSNCLRSPKCIDELHAAFFAHLFYGVDILYITCIVETEYLEGVVLILLPK